RVSLERGPLLSAGRVPQLDLPGRVPLRVRIPYSADGGEGLAVRAEGHASDGARGSFEGGALLAAGGGPQLELPGRAARPIPYSPSEGDGLAVRAERHALDYPRWRRVHLELECGAFLAAGHVQ